MGTLRFPLFHERLLEEVAIFFTKGGEGLQFFFELFTPKLGEDEAISTNMLTNLG